MPRKRSVRRWLRDRPRTAPPTRQSASGGSSVSAWASRQSYECRGGLSGTESAFLDQEDVADRWSLSEGGFFSSVPAGGRYFLKRIFHDWDDKQSATILRNCRQAMAPGGRILVIDAVVPPRQPAPISPRPWT
ncbi:methyltransferase [Streptomyces sp. ML-6]|uniref:methyltransferase n=1 Tax=Streptomyces sp. ML-6 TaxID=2982693 RepID=UPI0032DF3011